jgi:fatty acid desaturase
MPKVLTKVIGILALSIGLGSAAFGATWTASVHSGHWWHHHNFGNGGDPPGVTASAPEIDPAGALSALTLLLGGLAVVRGSRSKK